jgi:hypothetical protein
MDIETTVHIISDLLTGRIFRDIQRDEVLPYTIWALRVTAWLWIPLLILISLLVSIFRRRERR